MKIEAIYVSPGHNFFGRHGQPAEQHAIATVETVECVAGRGLRGDRFFDYKAGYAGQITFFSLEQCVDPRRRSHGAHRPGL
jgi:hypothetical protein